MLVQLLSNKDTKTFPGHNQKVSSYYGLCWTDHHCGETPERTQGKLGRPDRQTGETDKRTDELTDYFDRLLVVELLVPVEHPQEREGGEEDEAYPKEHVTGETGKVDPL